MSKKRLVFLTGTRADFGKLKSLIRITQSSTCFDVHIFVTGMHMNSKYGKTVDEIFKAGFFNIYQFINHDAIENMDRTLAKTIDGFSHYIAEVKPDLIIVHGDRVEALAGAVVGSMNNIRVAHIEGGEISGTIDELIRHAVSKMSHIHFVANDEAKSRLIQLGELKSSIFVIGSPDLDLMDPSKLPSLNEVKKYYNIPFDKYALAMFHPVTTEHMDVKDHAESFVDAMIKSGDDFVVIYPNNDLGSTEILSEYKRLEGNSRFRVFPSLRFEYFLRLLQSCNYIIGNSSAGVREAPYYNISTIDIGSRQKNRVFLDSIFNCGYTSKEILDAISLVKEEYKTVDFYDLKCFGDGNSDQAFFDILQLPSFWNIDQQKQFQEMEI